jgi:lipopolysaccharide/colanic/teichoic acid biosynthesis glycosyltransferase
MSTLAEDTSELTLSSPFGLLLATGETAHPAVAPTIDGGPSGTAGAVKRAIDLVGAGVLLLALLPVIAAAAVGVRCTSGGPVFYHQVRVGRGGRPFTIWKLRTFPVGHVDDQFSRPVSECPTAWGRLLRRTSIDELPQLWNVLLGDMSLVGPRPERPHFAVPLALEVDGYRERHRAPAGITGLAQVRGLWGNSSIEDRIEADNEYIAGWSIWLDLRILARTAVAVLAKFRT